MISSRGARTLQKRVSTLPCPAAKTQNSTHVHPHQAKYSIHPLQSFLKFPGPFMLQGVQGVGEGLGGTCLVPKN